MSAKDLPPGLPTDDRVGMTIGVSVMMTAIATCLILTRLYVRKFVANALGADDYVSLAALVGHFPADTDQCTSLYVSDNDIGLHHHNNSLHQCHDQVRLGTPYVDS